MKESERFRINEPLFKALNICLQKDVTTYLNYSLPLCGILSYKETIPWFYGHFNQLYTLTGNEDKFWLDYLEERWFYKDVADFSILESDVLKDEKDIAGFLENQIDSGFYIIIYVDKYYIPNTEFYRRNHFNHQIMLYGYNRLLEKFNGVCFDNSHNFSDLSFTYKDISDAYENGKAYYDTSASWVKKENVELFKPKLDFSWSFSLRSFLDDLNRYLSGKGDSSLLRPINLQFFGTQASYNINVYDDFIREYLKNSGNLRYFYINCFHLMAEHKTLMRNKLIYIRDQYQLNRAVINEIIERYSQVEKKLLLARTVFIKQSVLQRSEERNDATNRELTERIVGNIRQGIKDEMEILNKTHDFLSKF